MAKASSAFRCRILQTVSRQVLDGSVVEVDLGVFFVYDFQFFYITLFRHFGKLFEIDGLAGVASDGQKVQTDEEQGQYPVYPIGVEFCAVFIVIRVVFHLKLRNQQEGKLGVPAACFFCLLSDVIPQKQAMSGSVLPVLFFSACFRRFRQIWRSRRVKLGAACPLACCVTNSRTP